MPSRERSPLLAHEHSIPPPDEHKLSATAVEPCDLIPLARRQRFQIMAGLWLAVLLSALDMTITAALLAPIASSFGAAQRSGSLGTAFLLSNLTFTPLYGRLCDILGRRAANASAILLFTLGTLLCAAAPTMNWLIAARFLAGAGGGGMNTTSSVIAADLFPLRERGVLGGISTTLWALGGALGGPLGGLLADRLGWRAAFAVQVPLLVVSLASGITQIQYSVGSGGGGRDKESVRDKARRIDWVGCSSVFVATAAFLILLAVKVNEGRRWSDPFVVAALVVSPSFLVLFLVNEAYWATEPILPFRILKQRTPLRVMLVTLGVAVCNFGVMYSLPVWFLTQFDNVSAGQAGAHLFPTSIGNVCGGLVAGFIIHRAGRYRAASTVAGLVGVVGVVLVSKLTTESSVLAKWLDIFPMGFGFNHVLNTSFVALMASVPHSDMPAVTGCMWLFARRASSSASRRRAPICRGRSGASSRGGSRVPAELIRQIRSDSSILSSLPLEVRLPARQAYALALKHTFWFCALGALGARLSVCSVPDLDLSAAQPGSQGARVREEERRPLVPAGEAGEAIAERRVEREEEERATVVRRV